MKKKGKIAVQILIILVVLVATSAVIFLLVQYEVIKVKELEGASVLNMEFIPYMREGYLVVKEFKFCEDVGETYECVGEKESFELGDKVYFRFVIESSTVDGEVMLVENYRVKGPEGNVLLEVDERNNYYFDMKSKEETEDIFFKDFFVIERGEEGEYTLELILSNPLLNKRVQIIKTFNLIK